MNELNELAIRELQKIYGSLSERIERIEVILIALKEAMTGKDVWEL